MMGNLKSISISLNHFVESLQLIIDERKSETLFDVDDAIENGEARCQIVEGCFYDYEFSDKAFHFDKNHIVQHHPRNKHIGTISPNIYVGTLTLPFFKEDCELTTLLYTIYVNQIMSILKYICFILKMIEGLI